MSLHIVQFIGPINATSACTVGGPVNAARQARLPEAGATTHWCN